ncbi:MAG: cobyrinic acid a,c-diamide synthase [Cenarchaeum symbiont of Oopsacas minuta]|nr:cobyrinic acid a,c-diamide synthase [Cenarchaeum symbiont of Oopsacas minuta]
MSKISRLVLAGTSSGVGKTVISCGLIHAMRDSNYTVQPFKIGPDYIDPRYLSAAARRETRNLDSWIMGKNVIKSFTQHSVADISIIEGVMGYYDGAFGGSNYASTYHIASMLQAPTILVVDASKSSRSVAAIVLGFLKFHKRSRIAGIILNRLGSKRHEIMCCEALAPIKIPIVGCIMRDNSLILESRHLGLVPVLESNKKSIIRKAAKKISQNLDIKTIIRICNNVSTLQTVNTIKPSTTRVTISVALDDSFNFYYGDNLDALRNAGAKIKFFSPMKDSIIPKCDGLYIGGGFPEVQALKLAKNTSMKKEIKKFAESNRPIYAECGGLMYLSKSITHDNKKFKMVGLYDGDIVMTTKPTLNYTEFTAVKCLPFNVKSTIRGHEFHYSKMCNISKDARFAYKMSKGVGIQDGMDGLVEYETLASYGHLYFNSKTAKNIIDTAVASLHR